MKHINAIYAALMGVMLVVLGVSTSNETYSAGLFIMATSSLFQAILLRVYNIAPTHADRNLLHATTALGRYSSKVHARSQLQEMYHSNLNLMLRSFFGITLGSVGIVSGMELFLLFVVAGWLLQTYATHRMFTVTKRVAKIIAGRQRLVLSRTEVRTLAKLLHGMVFVSAKMKYWLRYMSVDETPTFTEYVYNLTSCLPSNKVNCKRSGTPPVNYINLLYTLYSVR